MDLSIQTKNKCFIVIILIIALILLIMFNKIIKKKNSYDELNCNCSVPKLKKQIEKMPDNNIVIEPLNNTLNKLSLYYTKWCGHSQNFMPEWEKIKKEIATSELNNIVKCYDIDCDVEKICSKNGVNGYPTIYLHKTNGQNIVYDGARDISSIIKFVKSELSK
jgi:thiol-disulfide isomerase/thioredoxin